MNEILQKLNSNNDLKIKTFITRITVNELNNLTQTCYYPDWKKYFYELLNLTDLTEKDLKDFVKRFYKGTKAQDSLLQSDIGSNLLVILMYYFLKKKDQQTYSSFMIFHIIRQYGNFIRRVMKFCKPEVFEYTLNHLNPTHLFSREKTIPNALFHLANETKKRYSNYILELNPHKISDMLYESRGRIAQSLKSFAEAYYRNDEKGYGILNPKESESGEEILPDELQKGTRVADSIASKICVYKEIDYKAFEQARVLTKVNIAFTTIIVKELQNPNLLNEVKFIIELFLKDVSSVSEICGKGFIPYVKKLMSIKRTSKELYFKNEINKLLLKIIKNTKIEQKYNKLTSQTQFQFNSFLAFYLTMYSRNLIC